tara:strand:- start:7958 stop:13471 length:5514 start_codon:yes stop_codon:yes gene_type:complete
MAKIQNTFTQGKMNKDLDERLLPVGQYRHAMNVQVETSEGSDIGTIQNVLGTRNRIDRISSNDDGVCVGVIADEKNNHIYYFVKMHSTTGGLLGSKTNVIVRYDTDTDLNTLVLVDRNNILSFEYDRVITGINIIDDLLFFTDDISEPKKININRCIQGTVDIDTHTKLVVNNEVTNLDLLEEHITVIKKAPKYPPVLNMETEIPQGTFSGSLVTDFSNKNVGDTPLIVVYPPANADPTQPFEIEIDDIILFQNYLTNIPPVPLSNYQVKAKVLAIAQGTNPPSLNTPVATIFQIEILSISPTIPLGDLNYYMSLDTDDNINKFEFKFPRFAYRYKYEDNEYSSFSPFSEIAFLAGGFDYHPRKGYNLGMTNRLTKLFIEEFVTEDQPDDVVAIDLLYKESDSSSVYILETLKPSDDEYKQEIIDVNTGLPTKRFGSYEVKSETIYSLLPSNQILRSFDNVPRFAKSQEIVANRLVYGNYVQNYNLVSPTAEVEYKTGIYVFSKNSILNTSLGVKSVKSLRDYQVGIVYSDEYGRETPVLTTNSSTEQITKQDADKANKLIAQVQSVAPDWAKGFKFYVKETSGEYYNLAMDRFYDAEDGNVWLAFASADRNKVDIDSYIILKKGSESQELVVEKAKYKVIAIENEAPDYIKEKAFLIGQATETNNQLFGNISNLNGLTKLNILADPSIGFAFKNGSLSHIHELAKAKRLRFRFIGSGTQVSNYYEVTSIGYEPDLSGYPVGEILINIEKTFGNDTDFIFDANGVASGVRISFEEIKVVNSPKFDGRFFVKILNDFDVKQNIGSNQTVSTNYKVVASRKLYFLSPNHIGIHSIGADNNIEDPYYNPGLNPQYDPTFHNYGAIAPQVTNPASYGANVNTSYGWTPGLFQNYSQDFWYKFTAFFRNQVNFDINDRSSSSSNTSYEDVWYIDGNNSRGAFSPTTGFETGTDHTLSNASPNNIVHEGMGITNYSNSSIIEIGFGGLQPDPNRENSAQRNTYASSTDGKTNAGNLPSADSAGLNIPLTPRKYKGWTNGGSSIYSIGRESENSHYGLEQKDFVDPIMTVGTQFRWKEDPNGTIYTITGNNNPDWFLLRYNAYMYGNGLGDSILQQTAYRPENWNRNFRISVDKPMTWNPIIDGELNGYSPNSINSIEAGGGSLMTGVSSATFVTMEIVQLVEDEVPLPQNPAIWETEPKDQTPLDIYYEASQTYPITLTAKDLPNIIKIGSIISQTDANGNLISSIVTEHDGDDIILVSSAAVAFTPGIAKVTDKNNNSLNISIEDIVQPGKLQINRNIHNSPIELNWYNCYSYGNGVESNRIEDGFNKVFMDNGAIASATLSDTSLIKEERRKYGLIFSGLYNSISSTNNLNQFIQAENITKEINPTYGSIQKLFTRQTDLVTLCEDRVLKILASKSALFTADGEANVTSSSDVLGQTIPFTGSFGISKNPESFVSESYRAYFTDKQRGAVLRLSMDGLTPISDAGMKDWFGDNLKTSKYLIGSYDQDKGHYNLTVHNDEISFDLQQQNATSYTISYSEQVKGWTSFKSFIPENGVSCSNKYYTFKGGNIFKHHDENARRNEFYDANGFVPSSVSFIFNQEPSTVKEFRTLTYEGSQSKVLDSYSNVSYKYLENKDGWYVDNIETDLEKGNISYFVEKENKWFNYIKGNKIDYANSDVVVDTRKISVQGIGFSNNIQVLTPPRPLSPGSLFAVQELATQGPLANSVDSTAVSVGFSSLVSGGVPFAAPSPPYNYQGNTLEYATVDNLGNLTSGYTQIITSANNAYGLAVNSYNNNITFANFRYFWGLNETEQILRIRMTVFDSTGASITFSTDKLIERLSLL